MTTSPPIARRDFLRLTGLAAGSLAVTPAFSAAEDFIAVPRSRTDRLATGANVCLWFRFPRNGSAEHFTNYISAAEADFMAHIGLKHVRLCVAPRVIMNPASGEILEERGKQLEAAIERFHRAGLCWSWSTSTTKTAARNSTQGGRRRSSAFGPRWLDGFLASTPK